MSFKFLIVIFVLSVIVGFANAARKQWRARNQNRATMSPEKK